jgi:hypothetical protein
MPMKASFAFFFSVSFRTAAIVVQRRSSHERRGRQSEGAAVERRL